MEGIRKQGEGGTESRKNEQHMDEVYSYSFHRMQCTAGQGPHAFPSHPIQPITACVNCSMKWKNTIEENLIVNITF